MVSKAIEYAYKELQPQWIDAPKKPYLSNPHTSQQALDYSSALKQYEEDMEVYKSNKKLRDEQCHVVHEAITEFIKEEACLYDIPKQYQDKVYAHAYEDGHSSGMYEVYLKLNSLVKIFF
jgi:hypothetical protein